jgi:hypothetical protein
MVTPLAASASGTCSRLSRPNWTRRTVVGRAAALRAAELTATAEDIRESIRAADLNKASPELLKQLGSLADQLVRIENLADRAERRLRQLTQSAAKGPTLSDYLREEEESLKAQEEANGRRA